MHPFDATADRQASLSIALERAYVRVDLAAPLARQEAGEVTVMRALPDGERTVVRPATGNALAMGDQARNLLAVVRGGERDPPSDAREAVEDLRVAREYVRMREDVS